MIPARTIPAEFPFWDKSVTLGQIRDGIVSYVQTIGDKKQAIGASLSTDVFFLAWTGKWSTDLLSVSREELLKLHASHGKKAA